MNQKLCPVDESMSEKMTALQNIKTLMAKPWWHACDIWRIVSEVLKIYLRISEIGSKFQHLSNPRINSELSIIHSEACTIQFKVYKLGLKVRKSTPVPRG